MIAQVKFHSLQGPEAPTLGRYAHDGKPARLLVKVGKSDTLREAPLTREQLLTMAVRAIEIVQRMDRDAASEADA